MVSVLADDATGKAPQVAEVNLAPLAIAAILVVSPTDFQPHVVIVIISCPFNQVPDEDSSGGVAIFLSVTLMRISHPWIDTPRPTRISSSVIKIDIPSDGDHTSWPPYKFWNWDKE